MTQAPDRPTGAPPTAGPSADAAPVAVAPPRRRRRPGRRTLAVAGVAVAAGLLFGTSATLFRQADDRQAQNLGELVRAETARLEEATERVDALRSEVQALVEEGSGEAPRAVDADVAEAVAAGRMPVTGPGLTVRLWDAPTANAPVDSRPDDLLVHQQDVEAVVNALWAGGAEAMTIQDQRVTMDTAVRCVGNVLLLRGVTYSPPYVISAIGDPEALQASLLDSPAVDIYLQYVDAVGLGWSVTTEATLEMPAAEGPSTLQHAVVPDNELAEAGLAAPPSLTSIGVGRP